LELFPPDIVQTLKSSKLIVNTTSIGMAPNINDSVTDLEDSFNKDQIVFDLIYNPAKTNLLRLAEKCGARVIGGMKMLVSQAAKSFELWTGEEMPVEQISKSLQLYIAEKEK
jgi:shikimate dehydrogenase